MIEMSGKVVLVTGGSRGIGACAVRTLARVGAQVILSYARSADEGPFTQPADPCAGMELDLAAPEFLGILRADNNATIAHDEDVGVAGCGLFVQAADLTTCQPSNVVSVP